LTIHYAGARVCNARVALLAIPMLVLTGCAGLPPGSDFPRPVSVALADPEQTQLGKHFIRASQKHDGQSGFRILTVGVDGFTTRMHLIDAAERTLDLQYYIFRGDETGRLLTDALLRAARRGVRVRLLIDDGDTVAGDEQVIALRRYAGIEVRLFNPFAYRGHVMLLRLAEFAMNARRLDYRMHNKLLVADNAVALIGGRNIGNQYFQMDPDSQFADDDVFAAGSIAQELSATFDEYWNSGFAIPSQALERRQHADAALPDLNARATGRAGQAAQLQAMDGIDYGARIATGEPYAGLVAGELPLVWARAHVVCDSPDKKQVEAGTVGGRLMSDSVAAVASAVHSELLMVTPYFVPADDELKVLNDLRQRGARVRVLTNSLESSRDLLAQAGYMHYRGPLLEAGVELYEARARLGNVRGSGQTARISRYGHYGLHAKLIIFDRDRLFIGSMNYDQRSRRINTEIGVIIDSPELAQQMAARFESMVQPEASYALALRTGRPGTGATLVWRTVEQGLPQEYSREPAQSGWRRLQVRALSLLPVAREL